MRSFVLFQNKRAGTIAKALSTHRKTEVKGFLISGSYKLKSHLIKIL